MSDHPDIRTRDQRYQDHKNDAMFVSRKLLSSDAWRALSFVGRSVYIDFLTRRQMEKPKSAKGKRNHAWTIKNNGEIVFKYDEAALLGYSRKQFRKALGHLVETGFIEVTYRGSNKKGDNSLYAIIDDWQKWDTPEFIPREFTKQKNNPGFENGNEEWKKGSKCKRKG
ncbi:hypothetical protein ACFL6U_09165 [Planctomycetota bacterium]